MVQYLTEYNPSKDAYADHERLFTEPQKKHEKSNPIREKLKRPTKKCKNAYR